jgi:hypothetical protein
MLHTYLPGAGTIGQLVTDVRSGVFTHPTPPHETRGEKKILKPIPLDPETSGTDINPREIWHAGVNTTYFSEHRYL